MSRRSRAQTSLPMGRMAAAVASVAVMGLLLAGVELATASAAPRMSSVAAVTADPPSVVTERQDKTSALIAAQAQGSRVEVLGLRTDQSQTFANPDGSFTDEAYAGPVRVQDTAGTWHDIDTTLTDTGSVVEPNVAAADVELADGTGTDALVSVSTPVAALGDAADATSSADDAANGTAASSTDNTTASDPSVGFDWPTTLPAPTLAGDVATYHEVQPGVDVQVKVLPQGFETFVVVKTAAAAATLTQLRLPIDAHALHVVDATDGGLVFKQNSTGDAIGGASSPLMWDSSTDPASGDPAHTAVLDANVSTTGGSPVLTVNIPSSFFAQDGLTYPVTIDPTGKISASSDAYVEKGYDSSNFGSDDELRTGTYDSGTHVARAFLTFPKSIYDGKQVTAASLHVYNYYSASCTAKQVRVQRLLDTYSESTVTWTNRPAIFATVYASSTSSHGWSSSCSADWTGGSAGLDVTTLAQGYADGSITNRGIALTVPDETDSLSWKKFRSSEYATAAYRPYLSVTYNNPPATAGVPTVSPSAAGWVNSLTPVLSSKVSDPDGGQVRASFTVKQGTSTVGSLAGGYVASGGTSKVTVPSSFGLANGQAYTITAKAYDGSLFSTTSSAAATIHIDTTKPGVPTVTASAYANNTWYDPAPGSNTFTFTQPSGTTDVTSFQYAKDAGSWVTLPATSGSATLSWAPTSGAHKLQVKTIDHANNTSASATTFSFGVGGTALTAPSNQLRSSRYFPIQATGPSGATGATVAWAHSGDTTFTSVGSGALLTSTGAPWTGTVTTAGSGVTTGPLTWDSSQTTGLPTEGLIDLKICITYSGSLTKCATATIQLVPHAFGGSFATAAAGPGQVSLASGELEVDATDAAVPGGDSDLSVSRSYLSQAGTPPTTGGFGAGWSATLPSTSSGATDATVADHATVTGTGNDGSIVLLYPDGSSDLFADSGDHLSFPGVGDTALDGSRLDLSTDKLSLTLTDPDLVRTTWTRTLITSRVWANPVVSDPDVPGQAATYSGTFSTTSAGLGFTTGDTWTTVVSPPPAGVTCTFSMASGVPVLTDGCRALTVVTAATGTTPPTGSALGDYPGRIRSVIQTLWDPDATPSAKQISENISTYTYDSTGSLREQWNPQADLASAHLKTAYTYTSGRLATITAAGLQPWRFGYDSNTRLATVKRNDPANSADATTTFVYDVPLSGTGLPDLTDTSAWGQNTPPASAAAVFGPDHVPASTPTSTDWPYASLTYMDTTRRVVNTASYGAGAWQYDATEYDTQGNTKWSLTADNRAQAVNPTVDTPPSVTAMDDPAERAAALATLNTYGTADPSLLTDSYGPTMPTVLADGTPTDARSHSHTTYDQGAPASVTTGGQTYTPPFRLPTTTTTSALVTAVDGTTIENDTKTTTTGYDPVSGDGNGWVLGQATTQTTKDVGITGHDITTVTRFDTAGRVTQTRQPLSTGTDALATDTVYYTSDASASVVACRNHPEWVGLACQTGPHAQPGTGATLPVTTTKYSKLLSADDVTEVSGSITRHSTTSFDIAGRATLSHVAVTGAPSGDQPLGDQSFGYDPTTGLPTTTTVGSSTVTTGYDTLGRVTSYTDASSVTSTTSYDLSGRPVTISDGRDTTTLAYDGTDAAGLVEHRGQVTQANVTAGSAYLGTFKAAYDPDGSLIRQDYPNGVVAATDTDPAGNETSLTYTASGASSPMLAFSRDVNTDGQVLTDQGGTSEKTYAYDTAGRLTTVTDTTDTGCATRGYTFDDDSNRTTLKTWNAGSGAPCPTPTGTADTTVSRSFDGADRIAYTGTGTSYSYDSLGRTRTLPREDTTGTTDVTLTYYAGNLVATEQTATTTTRAWGLDPAQRLTTWADTTGGVTGNTHTNHYSDSSDSPAWTDEGDGTWTRNVTGIGGDLALLITGAGSTVTGAQVQLPDLHGDIVATIDDTAAVSSPNTTTGYTEYGNPEPDSATTAPTRYGWLGAKTRSSDTLTGGLVLMGVRLYNPTSGRFLQVDPEPGGSDGPYLYPTDPITGFDLNGQWWHSITHWVSHHKLDIALTVASFVVPEAAGAIWAYRAYRLTRLAEAGVETARATRGTSWLAGKMWAGRGATRGVARNGARMLSRGDRAWRGAARKGSRGWSSNLERGIRGRHDYTNMHINHGPPRRWLPFW